MWFKPKKDFQANQNNHNTNNYKIKTHRLKVLRRVEVQQSLQHILNYSWGVTSDHHQGKESNMEERSIQIIPFNGERGKFRIWSGDFLAREIQLGYDIILRGTVKIQHKMHNRRLKKTVYPGNKKRTHTMTWFWHKITQCVSRLLKNRPIKTCPRGDRYVHGIYETINFSQWQERPRQDYTRNPKKLVRWCHRGPIILGYWDRTIDRRFEKIGSYH